MSSDPRRGHEAIMTSTGSTRVRYLASIGALGHLMLAVVFCVAPSAPVDQSWSHHTSAAASSRPPEAAATRWHERFEQLPGDFESPSRHDPETIARVYSVGTDDDGSPLLRARHDGAPRAGYSPPPAVHFGRPFRDPALALPASCILSWRWRVHRHPAVTDDPWLDVAASVYVMVQPPGLIRGGKGFKLGWLAKPGPAGTAQRGMLQVELRHDPAGPEWRSETVDLCELYCQAYGDPSEERVLYVGVLTDGDNTQSVAAADYADFRLHDRR